jgi:NHL repeat
MVVDRARKSFIASLAGSCAIAGALGATLPSRAQTTGAGLIAPYALARGVNDDVYIGDPGAERIFLRRDGKILAVAGSGTPDPVSGIVPPGYRDGPAGAARFNRPGGIIVMSDGSLLVADAGNHCVRRIDGGLVSTYAGEAARAGSADGKLDVATFQDPVAIASDGRGAQYVADFGVGIRKIERGYVTTLKIPGLGTDIRAIAATGDGTLFIADRKDSYRYAAAKMGSIARISRFQSSNAGERFYGTASGFYVVDDDTVLFADPVARTVRSYYLQDSEVGFNIYDSQTIPVHALPEDRSGFSAGDALDSDSRTLQSPTGVVMLSSGRLIVADPAAHTVVDLPAPDLRHPVSEDVSDLDIDGSRYYRIAFISNSYAYHNVPYDAAIGSVIERRLDASRSGIGLEKPARVLSIRIAPVTSSAESDYIETFLANGNFDLVVWMYNAVLPLEGIPKGDPGLRADVWAPAVLATLKRTAEALHAAGTPLLVADLPSCHDVSWLECGWLTAYRNRAAAGATANGTDTALREVLAESGLDVTDLYPELRAFELQPDKVPLYGTLDGHLSERGNELVGEAIARAIESRRPWSAGAAHP